MISRLCCSLTLLALLALPCAALEWKATILSITTAPFQVTQDVTFEFKNSGTKPVAILDLQTNCDCLAAAADRTTYASGESGHIKAQFTIGDRSGLYERLVTVVTDESPTPVRLLVKIEVPELFAVSPRSVMWKQNAPATEQVVDVTPAAGLEITFTEAQPTNPAFTASLEVVEPGKHYRVHLKPAATTAPASAAIRIFGKEKSGHKVIASAYATVE